MEPFVKEYGEMRPHLPVLFLDAWRSFSPSIRAGFSTRNGGVSGGRFASMNCGLHVGDDQSDVVTNRTRLAQAAGFDFDAWTNAEQVHGHRVVQVTAAMRGKGRAALEDSIPGADALVTDVPGVMLAAFFADCVPLYFYDPQHDAVGLAHAGWKGTVLGIAETTVREMQRLYGSNPAQLRAAIGPSIGACCYEVSSLVADHVREIDGGAASLHPKNESKYWLDLKQLNRHIMIKAGIVPSHIELSMLCTGCRTDLFFSHRLEAGKTGRMAAWIGIMRR